MAKLQGTLYPRRFFIDLFKIVYDKEINQNSTDFELACKNYDRVLKLKLLHIEKKK